MKLTVEVKPRHIKAGKPGECSSCPVALAVIEAAYEKFGKKVGIKKENFAADVSPSYMSVQIPHVVDQTQTQGISLVPTAKHQKHINNFIDRFDDDEKVAPFKFTAELLV